MSYIKRAFRSNQKFYVSSLAKPFIRYAYKSSAVLKDQKRIKTSIRGALDPVPRKILAQSLSKPPKKGTPGV